jgi:signal transduction histidine kinase
MKAKLSLRSRIALSYVLLALVLGSFLSAVAYISVEVAERYLIDKRLESLSTHLISRHDQGQAVDAPPGISFFADGAIPMDWQSLRPGFHEVFSGADELHALVVADGPRRFVVVDDQRAFETAEQYIFITICAGFLASLALASFIGLTMSRRVIAPVTALADAINQPRADGALPSLDAQDEIGVLARAFAIRTDELQQFLNRERLFTGDVSHELRTPLTIILGASEVLSAQLAERPELLAVAERIRRAAADTAERVSALLLLSRAPETLDAPRIELRSLIEREMKRCKPLLIGKTVECKLDAPQEVWLHARPELVSIALGNLLCNAYQYTDAGTVNVRLADDSLVIEDTGTGIPDSVRARLFERFVRGNYDRQSGTGLGLAIVKRVTDHLKWEIRLEARTDTGSRFTLKFRPADSFA